MTSKEDNVIYYILENHYKYTGIYTVRKLAIISFFARIFPLVPFFSDYIKCIQKITEKYRKIKTNNNHNSPIQTNKIKFIFGFLGPVLRKRCQ
jgi:hypothetical protein